MDRDRHHPHAPVAGLGGVDDDRDLRGTSSRHGNDYAYVGGDVRYGWVEDVIIGRDGAIQAVVVYPDVTYRRPGPYALPYYGTGFEPGADRYTVPYTAEEIAELDIFVLPQQEQPQSEQETGQQPAGKKGETQQK